MNTNQRGTRMNTPRSGRESQRGQVLVIVSGGAIALVLILGLVLDVGVAVFNRRDGQNVSDIMSLAGAKFIADVHQGKTQPDPAVTSTWTALEKSALANDCAAAGGVPCTWTAQFVGGSATGPVDIGTVTAASTVPSNALGVRVSIKREPRTFVINVIGMGKWDVNVEATAIAERPTTAPASNLLPIAFNGDPTTPYQPGQVYDLTDGKDIPGGFGWLSWDGSNSAGALATSLCTPNNPSFFLPSTFPADPGKTNSSSVRACLDGWIASGQTVLIPMYDIVTGNGNNATYRVIGVAAFVLTARDQPAVDNIRGYFVEIYPYTNPVPGGAGSQPPTADDTMFFMGLVR